MSELRQTLWTGTTNCDYKYISLAKIVITVTPVSNLEVQSSTLLKTSCLIFIPHHNHSSSHNCFAVVNCLDYFFQFTNCNSSGTCIIDSVKPSSQLHPLEKSGSAPAIKKSK